MRLLLMKPQALLLFVDPISILPTHVVDLEALPCEMHQYIPLAMRL